MDGHQMSISNLILSSYPPSFSFFPCVLFCFFSSCPSFSSSTSACVPRFFFCYLSSHGGLEQWHRSLFETVIIWILSHIYASVIAFAIDLHFLQAFTKKNTSFNFAFWATAGVKAVFSCHRCNCGRRQWAGLIVQINLCPLQPHPISTRMTPSPPFLALSTFFSTSLLFFPVSLFPDENAIRGEHLREWKILLQFFRRRQRKQGKK